MRSIAPPDSAVQSGQTVPSWRALLHARGFSDATLEFFGIQPNRAGWLYPVAPGVAARRWKAFPRHKGAKYRWKPSLPPDLRFYDPRGVLGERIREQGGALILASGEPDVWALHEAGIFNATATLHGEGTVPPWLVDELRRLGVTRVRVWPDRDQTGLSGALKLQAALAGSGIALEVRALPYPLDSKADINQTLLDVGPDALWATLLACPPLDLPELPPEPTPRPVLPPRNVPSDAASLYEQWCAAVEAEAVRVWQIAPPNAKNLSRKNFSSPYREDRRPSAQWNYTTHGFKDYATGEFTNTHAVAALLGFTPWDDYLRACRAAPARPRERARPDEVPRGWRRGVPENLVTLLLNLHGDTWLNASRGILPNGGAAATTYTVWHELVAAGKLGDTDPVTAAKLARLSADGRGLSKDTAASGLRLLADLQLIEFLSLSNEPQWVGTETRLIDSQNGSAGRKGEQYVLRPLDAALRDFLRRLEADLLAVVLVREYPDLPVPARALKEPLSAYGLSDEHLAAIDAASQPVYEAHRETRARALAEFRRRRGIFRAKYGFEALRSAAPLELPKDARTPNASAFRDAVDEAHLAACGGVRTDRRAAARRVGRGLGSHQAACARRGVVAVPQYEERALGEGAEVLAQCEALDVWAFRRGVMELVAPGGASVRVSERWAGAFDYDAWVAGYEGDGPVRVRIQRPSIEKRRDQATPEDLAAAEQLSAKQGANGRRRGQSKPGKSEPPAKTRWPGEYLVKQGELRAEACGVSVLSDGRFVTPVGEVLPRDAVALWRGLAAAVLPGPALAPLPRPNSGPPHHYANQSSPCVLCGEPGTQLHWTGWYCEAHAALPLDEKVRRWQQGRGDGALY